MRLQPADYREPPPPAEPALVLHRRARVAVYERRHESGLSLYHPGDLWRVLPMGLRVGVEMRHHGKNGADVEGGLRT